MQGLYTTTMTIMTMENKYNKFEGLKCTAVTIAGQLNAETSVSRERHCNGLWFLPAVGVLRYVDLLC